MTHVVCEMFCVALQHCGSVLLSAFLAADPGTVTDMENPWPAVLWWISWVSALGPTMVLIYKWRCCHPGGMKKPAQGHAQGRVRTRSVWPHDLCWAPHSWVTLASDSMDRQRHGLPMLYMNSPLRLKQVWPIRQPHNLCEKHYLAKKRKYI